MQFKDLLNKNDKKKLNRIKHKKNRRKTARLSFDEIDCIMREGHVYKRGKGGAFKEIK